MPFGAVGAIAGVASAASSIYGGIQGAKSAKSAAGAEQQALQQGINFQQGVYQTGQQNLQPFIGGGQSALQSLLGFYGLPGGNATGTNQAFGQFQQTPFYQFPLQQSTLATNRALAASGLTGSGAQLRDLSQLNAGYASQGLTGYLSGLGSLITGGQGAATGLLQGGNNTAQALANLYGNQGVAAGGGIIGSNNAQQQGFQQGIGALTGGPGGGVIGQAATGLGQLFNTSGSSYTGPSSSSLIGGQGSPAYLQGQLGLGAGQYVP